MSLKNRSLLQYTKELSMRRLYCPLVLLVLITAACGARPTATPDPNVTPTQVPQPTPIPPPEPGKGLSTLARRIMRHPEQYEGQRVTLVGYFRGPDLLDEIRMGPPNDRLQDWVVTDETGTLFVSYQGKLPFRTTSHEIWRIVRVTGVVALVDGTGKPYIVPDDVTWEGLTTEDDVLPAFCRVAIHRFEGDEQLDHHIYWYTVGNIVADDVKANWRGMVKLKRGEILDLDHAFAKVKFFDMPDTVGEPCQGCIRYAIAAVNDKENKPHFVTVYEGSVSKKLQAFIDLAIEMSAQAQPVG